MLFLREKGANFFMSALFIQSDKAQAITCALNLS